VCPAKMETAAGSWFWLSELCHASANRRVVYNPHSNDDDGLGSGAQSRSGVTEARDVSAPPYHRRFIVCCCILAGDTEGGGLDMVMPVAGLTIGIALRARVAEGWCSFKVEG